MSGSPDSQTGAATRIFLQDRTAGGWGPFVEHYGRTIRRWCRRCWRLGEEEADDLAQVVIVKLFEKMQGPSALWDPARGRFHAWLKTVTRHAWFDACKERQRALGPGGKKVREVLESDSGGEDFAEYLAQKEVLEEALKRARARVSPKEWEVFALRKLERLSAKEVAERLGLKGETVDNYTSKVGKVFEEERKELEGPEGEKEG
jgi:RNA polymerase sigma-70 factor (ECF subfamily)